MELHKAIKEIVSLKGKEIIFNAQIINFLHDYQAFKEKPAAKYIIKILIQEGILSSYLVETQNNGSSIVTNSFVLSLENKYGFDKGLSEYVLNCFLYAIGECKENQITKKENNLSRNNSVTNVKEHLLFEGHSIDGDVWKFAKYLESEGCKLTVTSDRDNYNYQCALLYSGDCGIYKKSSFGIECTPKSHLVKSVWVIVHLSQKTDWNTIKLRYYTIKEHLTSLYGEGLPNEVFEYPFFDGDGKELEGISKTKKFGTTFYLQQGTIRLTICVNQIHKNSWEKYILVEYVDFTNNQIDNKEKDGY